MKNKNIKRKAFTLIELLIVIAIIGILFIVLVSKVDFATDKAKATGVQTDFRSFQLAFDTVAKENAGFNTFGWDTGDANQDGIRNSYDEGDNGAGGGIAQNGIQDGTEVFTGHKVYVETFTKVFSLKKAKPDGTLEDNYDRDALNRLETAINANLDPKLHISIKDDGEIVMANGAKDPWKNEYHGWYISKAAEQNGADRGAIIIYSDGANGVCGSDHDIDNGVVSVTVPNSNKDGKDDYSIVSVYTYVNGYGEVKNMTTGFSNNQSYTGSILSDSNTPENPTNPDVPETPETPDEPEFLTYRMNFGANQYILTSAASAEFSSVAEFDKFVKVVVDTTELVENEHYTVRSGSTIVTLQESFISTLSVGEHTMYIYSEDGVATCKFYIANPVIPNNMPAKKADLANYTWDEIKILADAQLLNYDEYGIQLGDTKTSGGITYYLVDFNNYGGFCFMFVDSTMTISEEFTGNYFDSEQAETVNAYYNKFSSDLANVVKTANVTSAIYIDWVRTEYTQDCKVFMPSVLELGLASSTTLYRAEGQVFEYFLNNSVTKITGSVYKAFVTRSAEVADQSYNNYGNNYDKPRDYVVQGSIHRNGSLPRCPLMAFVVGSDSTMFKIPTVYNPTIPSAKGDLANYTWTEIYALASLGLTSEEYNAYGIQLGDKKENKTLVDFDNYGGFVFMESLPGTMKLHLDRKGTGSFLTSCVYNVLYNTYKATFSTELLSVLSPVNVNYFDAVNQTISNVQEYIFVPSAIELGGYNSTVVSSHEYIDYFLQEGEVFEYFQDNHVGAITGNLIYSRTPTNKSNYILFTSNISANDGSNAFFFNVCFVVGNNNK